MTTRETAYSGRVEETKQRRKTSPGGGLPKQSVSVPVVCDKAVGVSREASYLGDVEPPRTVDSKQYRVRMLTLCASICTMHNRPSHAVFRWFFAINLLCVVVGVGCLSPFAGLKGAPLAEGRQLRAAEKKLDSRN